MGAVFGAIVNGGFLTWWFGLLNKAIPAKDIKTVILKVGVNQAVLSPTLNTLMFLYIILTKDKRSLSQKWNDFQRKLAADLFPTIKRSLYFWGTIQCINFSFVPVDFTQIVTNIASVFWTAYVTLVGYRPATSEDN